MGNKEIAIALIQVIIGVAVVGLLFIIFNTVWTDYLLPAHNTYVDSSITDAATIDDINAETIKVNLFWDFVPWIILIVLIVALVVAALKTKEDTSFG